MKIYFVEDEKDLSSIVTKYLIREGYNVSPFYDGETAIKYVADPVDLWILDIMLPGDVSGYDLIKAIKEKNPNAAVIFTSARDQGVDKIMGLELGSDDYIAKPYSNKELLLRVKAVLKRTNLLGRDTIKYDPYVICLSKREVYENGEKLSLTTKEFDLLSLLVKNKNVVLERDEIITSLWGEDFTGRTRVVDDLMRRLRSKMPELRVETIYGVGYKFLWKKEQN